MNRSIDDEVLEPLQNETLVGYWIIDLNNNYRSEFYRKPRRVLLRGGVCVQDSAALGNDWLMTL